LIRCQSRMGRGRHRPLDFLDHTVTKNYSDVYLAPTRLSSKHYTNCDRPLPFHHVHPTKHTLSGRSQPPSSGQEGGGCGGEDLRMVLFSRDVVVSRYKVKFDTSLLSTYGLPRRRF
jgi:hypothetical protein